MLDINHYDITPWEQDQLQYIFTLRYDETQTSMNKKLRGIISSKNISGLTPRKKLFNYSP